MPDTFIIDLTVSVLVHVSYKNARSRICFVVNYLYAWLSYTTCLFISWTRNNICKISVERRLLLVVELTKKLVLV